MNHRFDPQAWLIGICAVFLVSVFIFFSGWILISVLGGDSEPDDPRIETVYFRDDGSAYIKECHETSGGFYAGKVFVPTNRTECKEIEVEFTKP